MTKLNLTRLIWLLCLLVALAACKEKIEIVEVVRSVKTIKVEAQDTEKILKFSGKVTAVDSSGLSFEVPGQVASVNVDIGNPVKKDQVLAVLDAEPFQLEVDAAQAELIKARDNVSKTKSEFERQKRIFEEGAGAERFVEVAEFNYKAARSAVNYAVAKLDLARRNLRKTKLLSPYDGAIAWRAVEPNEKVRAGQKIFEIDASGKLQIELAIPETTVDQLKINDPVTVTYPTLPGESENGRITEIGSAAVKAGAFPVKVELNDPDPKVKPGMTAEASFAIKDKNRKPGYLVPFQALLPGTEPNRGFAFVYDPATSTVKKTPVHSRGAEQKKAIVDEGLAEGDIIAVAGVSFLADGMKVKLLEKDAK